MFKRTAAVFLILSAASAAYGEEEADPKIVLEAEATDNLPDMAKRPIPPVPPQRPDDSKLTDSIDSGEQGG